MRERTHPTVFCVACFYFLRTRDYQFLRSGGTGSAREIIIFCKRLPKLLPLQCKRALRCKTLVGASGPDGRSAGPAPEGAFGVGFPPVPLVFFRSPTVLTFFVDPSRLIGSDSRNDGLHTSLNAIPALPNAGVENRIRNVDSVHYCTVMY